MFEYCGNIHIHSTYSDGGLPVSLIAKKAARTGLDFIIITDHRTLAGLYKGEEGYHDGILVLIGMEVNQATHHYLALDVNQVVKDNEGCPQEVIDEVNYQEGIGIIAHPHEKGSPLYNDGLTFQWTDWCIQNIQGIEIWNFLSQWRDGITGITRGLYLLLNPHQALRGPYQETMKKWDSFQISGQKVMAYGGSDAHGIRLKRGILNMEIGSYDLSFRCINMHILSYKPLTGEKAHDRRLVHQALRKGRSWVGYDYFYNSRGFRFELHQGDKVWTMGNQVKWARSMWFKVNTPRRALVKCIKNGKLWCLSKGTRHIFAHPGPGVYRVEVYHRHYFKWRPWIFSNPIWLV
ncbi:PHP domain-containing protein [Syntrophomonas erecta]